MTTNLVVEVHDNNIEAALRIFKKKSVAGLTKEIRRHDYYTKPGDAKRLKSAIARKKLRKAAKRTEMADRDPRSG